MQLKWDEPHVGIHFLEYCACSRRQHGRTPNSVIAQMHISLGSDNPNSKVASALAIESKAKINKKKTSLKRSRNTLSLPLIAPLWVLSAWLLERTYGVSNNKTLCWHSRHGIYLVWIYFYLNKEAPNTMCLLSGRILMFICRSRWRMSKWIWVVLLFLCRQN